MKLKRRELLKRLESAGFKYIDSSRHVWTMSPIVIWSVVDADEHVELEQGQKFIGDRSRLAELALATGFDFMDDHDVLKQLAHLRELAQALTLCIEQIAKEIEKK